MKIINVTVLLFKNFGKQLYIGKSDGMLIDMKLEERGVIHQYDLGEKEGKHF